MKKWIYAGMMIATISLSADEAVKDISKQEAKKKVLHQEQLNANTEKKEIVKKEVKIKNQNYPRGNIATH